jgi:hypothetical protein
MVSYWRVATTNNNLRYKDNDQVDTKMMSVYRRRRQNPSRITLSIAYATNR